MTLKVIGAGFGRTGTLSLKFALERLGFTKCYHMMEVVEQPHHAPLWQRAWRGAEPWDTLFDGYAAAVDWPAAAFWAPLMAFYPEAKVVLTVREATGWYESAKATIFRSMQEGLRSADPRRRERMAMAKEIIVDGTFGGDLDGKANAIAVYETNVARVMAAVPRERLVVFDSHDGWPPLCAALGVAEPDEPYPRVNTTSEFHARWRGADRARGRRPPDPWPPSDDGGCRPALE